MADALRSGRSVRKDVWVQIPPSAPYAPVAQRIERSPAEAEVVGSNLTRRTIFGRLAQRLEHLLYTQGVTGSNPVSPTIESKKPTIQDSFRTFLSAGCYLEVLINL